MSTASANLQPSWLLRHMPRLLVMASFAMMVLLWVGVSWRLTAAKHASLEQGAKTSHAMATAIAAAVDDKLQHAQQALFTVQALSAAAAEKALRDRVAERLGLPTGEYYVQVVDGEGRTLMASGETPLLVVDIKKLQVPWGTPISLKWGDDDALGLVASLIYSGKPAYAVVAYRSSAIRAEALAALAGIPGHVRVMSGADTALFDYRLNLSEIDGERYLESMPTVGGLQVVLSVPMDWALTYYYSSAVPATVGVSVLLGLVTWSIFITAALGFKRALSAQQELTRLVALDPLTGLPNRRTFTDLLAQGLASSQRTKIAYGLLFIDLDNFKYVNDTLGHDAGDLLLKEIAKRLSAAVRATDYVCRLGGDEFVVLLTALASADDAEEVARRILQSLEKPIRLGDTDLHMGASLGVALAPRDAQTASQLVICADMAVYRAKAEGKGRYAFFDESLRAKVEARSRIANDIRRGIEAREFYLAFQPKMALSSGRTSGFEALMRWKHPRLGDVQPSEFIPIAEETGVIESLGDLALELAIAQMRKWYDAGEGWQAIAVNVSSRQLKEKDLVKRISDLLDTHEVPASSLQVELTESMLAMDETIAAGVIRDLKALGVRISVDDFGTGYSSLSALQRFDVDYLKIDRSFVSDIDTNADSLEICRAIVQMAHALRMQTIAEGVETPAQYEALLRLGCDEAQGYLLAKPMTESAAVEWARAIAPPFADTVREVEV